MNQIFVELIVFFSIGRFYSFVYQVKGNFSFGSFTFRMKGKFYHHVVIAQYKISDYFLSKRKRKVFLYLSLALNILNIH